MPVLRHVYDPATGTYVDVEVSNAVYNCYRRTSWAICYNDQQFHAHEIQFSSLKGGEGDAFEGFSEFISEALDPERLLCEALPDQALYHAFMRLTPADRQLLRALILEGKTERWYAQQTGLSQKTIHNRKQHAIRKLKRFLHQERNRI